jgi:hypothetical protein
MSWFSSKKSAPLSKIVEMSPEFMETSDCYVCVGIDSEKKLWLLSIYKRDYQNFENDKYLLRAPKHRHEILGIEQLQSGGLVIVIRSEEGGVMFYRLQRCLSGRIFVEGKITQIFDYWARPARPFFKKDHSEYDLLECLFHQS